MGNRPPLPEAQELAQERQRELAREQRQNKKITPPPKTGIITPGGPKLGFMDDDADLMILPVAYILQGLSPEVVDHVPGASIGTLWLRVEKKALPKRFVPVQFYREVIKWRDRKEGGGMVWRSRNIRDPKVEAACAFPPADEAGNVGRPEATRYINCVALFEGMLQTPVIIGFSSTAYADGRQFYNLAKKSPGNLWDHAYTWEGYGKKGNKGAWAAIGIDRAKDDSTAEEIEEAKRLYAAMTNVDIEADHQPAAGEDTAREPGSDDVPEHLRK